MVDNPLENHVPTAAQDSPLRPHCRKVKLSPDIKRGRRPISLTASLFMKGGPRGISVRIDVHSHLNYLPYLEYLAGRSSLPKGVLRGGTYFTSCTGGYEHASPIVHTDVDQKLRDMEDLGIGMSIARGPGRRA